MPNRVHPEELRALQVLQTIEPAKFRTAVNRDRPDIQCLDGTVGVEVTRAIEQAVSALLATDQHSAHRRPHPARLHLGHTVGGPRDAVFPNARWTSGNDMVAAYQRKARLLPGYASFAEQDLFLFMLPEASDVARLRGYLRTVTPVFTVIYMYDQRHCWRLETASNTITRFVVAGRSADSGRHL
ncbi:hypothetical protein [Lacticaseibacillus absianus]|uniref:hypothetical protein n=1 Tax=Lacticaseibacillus absianus TaxID=2729623 RepID=UPI0015CA2B4E|nr:hypothetical protein [Lacticaseibacillus absianus]